MDDLHSINDAINKRAGRELIPSIAVSVVILAAVGGIMIPSFVMPDSLKILMNISPLHWCIEAYYGLFLEGGKLNDILTNILSLFAITVILQLIALWGLKRKNLI